MFDDFGRVLCRICRCQMRLDAIGAKLSNRTTIVFRCGGCTRTTEFVAAGYAGKAIPADLAVAGV